MRAWRFFFEFPEDERAASSTQDQNQLPIQKVAVQDVTSPVPNPAAEPQHGSASARAGNSGARLPQAAPSPNTAHAETAESIAAAKQDLRTQIRARRLRERQGRSGEDQAHLEECYAHQILKLLPADARPLSVAAFLSVASEPPITFALEEMHRRGHRILVPVVKGEGTMAWVQWDPQVQHPMSALGITEPKGHEYGTEAFVNADLRLIPALAYGFDGRRLGQGGGYYDRLIPQLTAQELHERTVGVVFSQELRAQVPYDRWDAVLPRALTETGLYRLGTSAPEVETG